MQHADRRSIAPGQPPARRPLRAARRPRPAAGSFLLLTASLAIAWAGSKTPAARACDLHPDAPSDATTISLTSLSTPGVELVNLDPPQPYDGEQTLLIPIDGAMEVITLHPARIRSDHLRVVIASKAGSIEFDPPPESTYSGVVERLDGSRVALTAGPFGWTGVILIPSAAAGSPAWRVLGVQPAATLDTFRPASNDVSNGAAALHVVHEAWAFPADVEHGCAVEPGTPAKPVPPTGGIAGPSLRVADVAMDTDVEYVTHVGGVTAALLDIETVMHSVNAIYEAQLGIRHELSYVVIRTDTDPYDTNVPATMLNLLRNHWNASAFNARRDTVHMFTGRTLDNGRIGIANIGELCDLVNAYGLSATTFSTIAFRRTALTAHELAHNWNAVHCNEAPIFDADCRIMCATLCGCGSCTTFAARAVNDVTAFRNALPTSCVPTLPPPLPPPFADSFSGEEIDTIRWTYVNDANIFAGSQNPPSPPNALLLNAFGPGTFEDDEIRSNVILLGGAGNIALSYFTQHRFVEPGESLIVEYYNVSRLWTEINRVISDGSDPEFFTLWMHALPADAKHNGFRLRFRVEVDENNDQWFVDDVRIAAPGVLNVQSTPAPVDVALSPSDANGAAGGLTPFARSFPTGISASLTAPGRVGGLVFLRWVLDGAPQPDAQRTASITVGTTSSATASYAVLGDMNGDGAFNNFDIDPFVLALVNRPVYESWFPGVNADIVGDYDASGSLTNFDIADFIDALLNIP
ncbi:MAG: hypothetical protein HRU75_13810 [Planctomycetia bacterium]|nr:MAG: hypothetical protein HRU75_13810 [Planctomycetia bacterium]